VKPLDWLRAKVAAAVRIDPGSLGDLTEQDVEQIMQPMVSALENLRPDFEAYREGQATFVLDVDFGLQEPTQAAFEQVRQALQVVARPSASPSWSSRCDCWPHYIDCCCYQRKRAVSSNGAH